MSSRAVLGAEIHSSLIVAGRNIVAGCVLVRLKYPGVWHGASLQVTGWCGGAEDP